MRKKAGVPAAIPQPRREVGFPAVLSAEPWPPGEPWKNDASPAAADIAGKIHLPQRFSGSNRLAVRIGFCTAPGRVSWKSQGFAPSRKKSSTSARAELE